MGAANVGPRASGFPRKRKGKAIRAVPFPGLSILSPAQRSVPYAGADTGLTCVHTHTHTAAAAKSLPRVRLCATPQTAAHQAPRPWDLPGRNTGVGCHCLLQCMKVKTESEVAQSCPTLCAMDRSPPGSSVHGICQARVLEWAAIAFSGKKQQELPKLCFEHQRILRLKTPA